MSVCGNTSHIVKAVNTQEDRYLKNFNVACMKQNYCHYWTRSKPNCRKKDAPNEIIRLPSLENSNQWSSITKKCFVA